MRYFSKSAASKHHLAVDAKASDNEERQYKLVRAGATRFSTNYLSIASIELHFRAIQRLIREKTISVKVRFQSIL